MKKLLFVLMVMLVTLGCSVQAAPMVVGQLSTTQNLTVSNLQVSPQGSCQEQDYAGTKLVLCVQLCERPYMYTWQQREAFLRLWLARYRDVPFCYL